MHGGQEGDFPPPPVFEFAADGNNGLVSSLRARRAKKMEHKEAKSIPALASSHIGVPRRPGVPEGADGEGDRPRIHLWGEHDVTLATPPTVKSQEQRTAPNPLQQQYAKTHDTKFTQSAPVLHPQGAPAGTPSTDALCSTTGRGGAGVKAQSGLRRANRPHIPLCLLENETAARPPGSEWREPDVCTPIQRTRTLVTTQRPKLAVSPDFEGMPARKVSKRWQGESECGSLIWFMSRRGGGVGGRKEDEDEDVRQCNEMLKDIRMPCSQEEGMRFVSSPSLGKRDRHGTMFETPPLWALAAPSADKRSSSHQESFHRGGFSSVVGSEAPASHGLYSAEGRRVGESQVESRKPASKLSHVNSL
mmetsp:Transcript_3297/g.7585  ORF Transcript_3297/g.7585 Transcript_3297/m.7585 type:complete len:361 (-) Transcript_3297:353-1435(-)